MKLEIAITTAPRPRPTLHQSVDSLRTAGFTQHIYIFSDGDTPHIEGATIVTNVPPLLELRNYGKALRWMLDRTNADWIMMLEDDILWAHNSAAALKRDLAQMDRTNLGYLSLYFAINNAREVEQAQGVRRLKPGWYRCLKGMKAWGAQAYVFPRESAQRLLDTETFQGILRTQTLHRDAYVSECFLNMGLAMYYRVPCMVNHDMGTANSSIRTKPVQPKLMTNYFTGEA